MTDDPKDLLIEQAASAFRDRDAWGRILASPAWHDLTPEERTTACVRQLESRILESSLDPNGRSSTVRAVMKRLGR
jgi:hypothetical protein